MTEKEIQAEFLNILWFKDEQKHILLLGLRDQAKKSGLQHWVQLIDSRIALIEKRYDDALSLVIALIEDTQVTENIKWWSHLNRGVAYGEQGKLNEAIADFTSVIEDANSPAEAKARARSRRSWVYGQQGKANEEIADCTSSIETPFLSAEMNAYTRYNRGVVYEEQGKLNEAIADYTAVIEDANSPAEAKTKARHNRGVAYGRQGKTNEEIADYTAVIEDTTSPAEHKAKARLNRGITYGNKGKTNEAIADFTSVIEDTASPAEQKAKARLYRGVAYGKHGKTNEAIADYTAIVEDKTSPAEVKERAQLAIHFYNEKKPELIDAVKKLPVAIDENTRDNFLIALENKNQRKNDFFSESLFDDEASFLLVLREWNSYTPAIPGESERIRGGGYFIKHQGTGIVIDPGFDFLEIFNEAGGRLCDIDHIVITHAHNDHTAEFESILMLLHEFNNEYVKQPERKKKIKVYLSQGAARKFAGFLQFKGCDYIEEIVTLNSGNKINPQKIKLSNDISLTVLTAFHDDIITQDYSVGLGIQFKFKDIVKQLLFTSDTAIFPDQNSRQQPIHKRYPDPFCKIGETDLLIAHIGSIEEYELKAPLGEIETISEEGMRRKKFIPYGKIYEKHLGLKGVFTVLFDLQPKAAIVSEFGEEMRSIWIESVRIINKKLSEVLKKKKFEVFAADPVLIYNICDGKFLCHSDLIFKSPDKLIMKGLHEIKQNGSQGPVHPYLFDKSDDILVDISPYEDKIKQFHDGLRNQELPHFRRKQP
jgi:hypothetical protein